MKDTIEAKIKLAKRALGRVKSTSIPVVPMMNLNGSQGMVLGDMKFSVKLSKPEMLGLIKSETDFDVLFEDLEVKEMGLTDVAQRFCDQLIDKLWPKKGASKRLFNGEGIEELKSLTHELDEFSLALEDDKADYVAIYDTLDGIYQKLKAIKGGYYTFWFKAEVYVSASHCKYYEGDSGDITTPWADSEWLFSCDYSVPVKIKVTAKEVLGFLYGLYPNEFLFEGLCEKPLDANYFIDKIKGIPCASEIPLLLEPTPNGPRCVLLMDFGLLYPHIDGWITILYSIMAGEGIEEGNGFFDNYTFNSYLKYFDYLKTCDPVDHPFSIDNYYGEIWS